MGGNHSYQFDEKNFQNQWERKQGGSFDGRSAWKNKLQPSRQIEEYPIYADTEEDIEILRELFTLRKDSAELVAATHLKETVKGGLCSSSAQGRLFLQRIPLKLQALQHIPFPDILHLHFNALTGYNRLYRAVGAFRPQSEQIGFNSAGEAKVWLNGDFSASSPVSRQISEGAMVRNLLQIIEDCTDNSTTPKDNPSILNYIFRNKTDVTFDQALSSIKEYANQYNGGIIPKNLECIQRVGLENIQRTLVSSREGSLSQNNLHQSERNTSTFNNIPVTQTPVNATYVPFNNVSSTLNGSSFEQRQPVFVSNTTPYQPSQVQQTNQTVYQPFQNVQPVQNVQSVQLPQPVQYIQPAQNILPVQMIPIVQPGTSGVRTQNINFNQVNVPVQNQVEQRFLQSQVQTVRPTQPILVRPPEEQRVIQQIFRSPQNQGQVNPQQQIHSSIVNNSVNQGSRVNQQSGQVFYQNVPVAQNIPFSQNVPFMQKVSTNDQQEFVGQNPTAQTVLQSKESQIQILNRLQLDSQPHSYTEVQQSVQETVAKTETYEQQFIPKARNFIDSNTMSIGIDRANNQELESYTTSPQKNVTGLNFEATSSRFKDVSLEDGKSSEALLAALRGFPSSTSSRKDIDTFNGYNYTNTYSTRTENTYEFKKDSYTYQPATEQTSSIYTTFNKYAKGSGAGLEENIEMKYSMTKNLYEPASTSNNQYESSTNYQYESSQSQQTGANLIQSQYEYGQDLKNFHQEGEYHVDFDPQILADIQKLKG